MPQAPVLPRIAFASFNDRIGPLLASPSERVELRLLHRYAK
jgi:hypothetical protein